VRCAEAGAAIATAATIATLLRRYFMSYFSSFDLGCVKGQPRFDIPVTKP
jgi:hypothetical protein